MKRIFLSVLAALVTAPALAAGPAKAGAVPDIFNNEPPYIQNQVCGELLAGMARMTADLYGATGQPAMKTAAVMAGTRAMVFIKANATLTADEQAKAKRIAQHLEQKANAKNPAVEPYGYCEARIQRWLKEGVVTLEDVRLTEVEVRTALDRSVKPAGKR
jgi:hypothetical protein